MDRGGADPPTREVSPFLEYENSQLGLHTNSQVRSPALKPNYPCGQAAHLTLSKLYEKRSCISLITSFIYVAN